MKSLPVTLARGLSYEREGDSYCFSFATVYKYSVMLNGKHVIHDFKWWFETEVSNSVTSDTFFSLFLHHKMLSLT